MLDYRHYRYKYMLDFYALQYIRKNSITSVTKVINNKARTSINFKDNTKWQRERERERDVVEKEKKRKEIKFANSFSVLI